MAAFGGASAPGEPQGFCRNVARTVSREPPNHSVKATVENGVADDNRAAVTVTCELPGGRKLLADGILELEGGQIIRELNVVSGDPK